MFTSTHDADEFKQVFKRMGALFAGLDADASAAAAARPARRAPGRHRRRPPRPAAEWLASVNLGNADAQRIRAQDPAAPEGPRHHVIITEYDLPRKEAQPHDVIVDEDGKVWYSDFGDQFVGVLDPKTGKAKDIPIPVLKPEQPKGGLDIEFDPGKATSGWR